MAIRFIFLRSAHILSHSCCGVKSTIAFWATGSSFFFLFKKNKFYYFQYITLLVCNKPHYVKKTPYLHYLHCLLTIRYATLLTCKPRLLTIHYLLTIHCLSLTIHYIIYLQYITLSTYILENRPFLQKSITFV